MTRRGAGSVEWMVRGGAAGLTSNAAHSVLLESWRRRASGTRFRRHAALQAPLQDPCNRAMCIATGATVMCNAIFILCMPGPDMCLRRGPCGHPPPCPHPHRQTPLRPAPNSSSGGSHGRPALHRTLLATIHCPFTSPTSGPMTSGSTA